LNLPPDFIRTIESTYGKDGKQLIANLPALIEEASTRWSLISFPKREEFFNCGKLILTKCHA